MPPRERFFAVLIVVWLALLVLDLVTHRHGFWLLLIVSLAGLGGDCVLLYKARRLRLDAEKTDGNDGQ